MKFTPVPENDEELHLPELVYWASLGDLSQVTELLLQGVSPDTADEDGYSALQAAAENGYLDVVKKLVEKGANVDHKGQYTALELAKMAEQHEIVDYLKNV